MTCNEAGKLFYLLLFRYYLAIVVKSHSPLYVSKELLVHLIAWMFLICSENYDEGVKLKEEYEGVRRVNEEQL